MAFTRLKFQKDWRREADFPTYQDSEEQVRADLQYHPDALRDFLNDELLPALENKGAAALLGAAIGEGAATIQSVLDRHAENLTQLAEDITTLAAGGVPAVVRGAEVKFSDESWAVLNGMATLTIPESEHKRSGAAFGYNLYQLVDGVYKSGTWGTAATRVSYSAGGSITLTADEAYSGKIVFFGM